MNESSDCGCDIIDSHLITINEALHRLDNVIHPIEGQECLAIRQAIGRVLAQSVTSAVAVPPHRNSAMDGYALKFEAIHDPLTVVGESFAGKPYHGQIAATQCVRIMTGAVVPEGLDTVIMQEQVDRSDDVIKICGHHRCGENIREPGEDVKKGDIILNPGKLITPADLGLLASLGVAEVKVFRRVRVAFFSTGDELKPVGQTLAEGDIYDSNRYSLYGLLTRLNVEMIDMGIIEDNPEKIRTAFNQAADIADVVITSGGVSVGDADYVKQILDELGEITFWKLAIKPGKPLAFGKLNKALFFGLPGNPVSVMATFYQVVQPALKKMMGQPLMPPIRFKVRAGVALKKSPGRLDFQRGILVPDDYGELSVISTGHQGSHLMSGMSQANCFIVLPQESKGVVKGEMVEVEPFFAKV